MNAPTGASPPPDEPNPPTPEDPRQHAPIEDPPVDPEQDDEDLERIAGRDPGEDSPDRRRP